MISDETQFRDYLMCWGSDVRVWPEGARALGHRMQHLPEYAALLEKEKRFERLLREDHAPSVPVELAQRIITAALAKQWVRESEWRLSQWLGEINPTALAATLVLGFAIGFTTIVPISLGSEELSVQSYTDDEGAML